MNPNNLLKNETSPYLLQHADNPVDWHPWNQDTLALAKKQNKPILLSVGYSACHWCHVMAHESFEDEDTAKIMNELFINVKVDREERPDLDKIYQTSHSLLTGRPGGWPLTIFMTPDEQMPFYAGTYFPDKPRYNMPSFKDILNMVSNVYQTRKEDIDKQNESLNDMLKNMSQHSYDKNARLTSLPLDLARKQIESEFEGKYGGFSGAPKFPHPAMIERALRHWSLMKSNNQNDEHIIKIALFTLKQMALGGIFDHVGGGFCRYSTDEQWMIPHFEKMLYDNGQLLPLYCYAYQITKDPIFERAATQTADWVIREMQSDEGGYYSAQDADSDGVEGKFYIWTPDEIKNILGNQDYEIFSKSFGLNRAANFEGAWHLHTYVEPGQLANEYNLSESKIFEILDRCRKILFNERAKRINPGRDDKILTSWNALMIRGMVIAGRTFNKSEYIASAKDALDFIKSILWKDNHLLATYKDNKAHLNAYLDDYAFLLSALLDYLQSNWNNDYLIWAKEIADTLLNKFEDTENGGFYFTSHDHEKLIQRSMTFSDDAMPSGNAIAASALQRIGLLLANTTYLDAAENCLKTSNNSLQSQAIIHCNILHALEENINSPTIVVIRGDDDIIQAWQDIIHEQYLPGVYVVAIPTDEEVIDELKNKQAKENTCAYICEGTNCLSPIESLGEFIDYFESGK